MNISCLQGNTLLHYIYSIRAHGTANKGYQLQWQDRLRPTGQVEGCSAIQLLIEAGADLRSKNNEGMSPLIFSMQNGEKHKENIRTLILFSKREDLNEEDNNGYTALHHLAKMSASPAFLKEFTQVSLYQSL